MMPLGLKGSWDEPLTEEGKYLAKLFSSHDFAIDVDVVDLDHTPRRTLTPYLLDGQVNLQRDSAVRRTATFTFNDPEHSMHLDADSPYEGAVFADRMLQVRHTVTVAGVGKVVSVPFVGPIVKVSRDGDTLNVECQDKASLALTGGPPVKVKKGTNAVDAIRKIMTQAAGESRFRLPSASTRNIHKSYATGWKDESSPWVVAQRIAAQINRQLLYSCDGYLTLRALPTKFALTVPGFAVTSPVQVDFDATEVSNIVRVTGALAPKPAKTTKKKSKPDSDQPTTKLVAVAVANPKHLLSPQRLGRNGVPRYLPTLIEGAVYKSLAQARDLAVTTLSRDLSLTIGVGFDMVPVFHLDSGDLIAVQTDEGRVVMRLEEASIPLAIGGDMSIGRQRRVSRGPHQARVHVRHWRVPPPKKKRPHRKRHAHHG